MVFRIFRRVAGRLRCPATLLGLWLLTLSSGPAHAQQQGNALPAPRLLTILPCGARAGTTVEMAFTGQDLDEPERLVFSHPGIKAEAIVTPPPPVDPKKPPATPPKPTVSKFKVTVPADVPLGHHDVRLVGKHGISNPRVFVVGDQAEALEKEPNNEPDQAQRVELNGTVNGNLVNQVDVDYYTFAGKKGQRVVFACQATSIDSKLDPEIKVYSAKNRMLVSNVSTYKDNDVVLDAVLPDDGDYTVRLCESTHTQGSPEHFYRLTITTAPWIDAVVPSALEPGKATQVTVWGRNLPGGQKDPTARTIENEVLEKITTTVTAPTDAAVRERQTYSGTLLPPSFILDGFEFRLKGPGGSSNPYFLTFARGPVAVDNEKNDTAETAQALTLPCEVSGRIERPGDADHYSFTAKKGEVWSFEMVSDRIGAPGDMFISVINPTTKQAMIEEDDPKPGPGNQPDSLSSKFLAYSRDPGIFRFAVPADGTYRLVVGSRTGTSECGPRNLYTLRISPEMPDFRLVAMSADWKRPEGCVIGAGGQQNFTVFAWRRDGFAGDIALSVEGLPKGVTCPPQVLGANVRHAFLVMTAAADAQPWTGEVKVKGTATINGKPVTREARTGSISWPVAQGQNSPALSRLDRSLALAVRDKAPYSLTASIDKPSVLQGETAKITVKVNRISPDIKAAIQIQNQQQLQGMTPFLPQGVQIQAATVNPNQNEATLTITVPQNALPGNYNLALTSLTQVQVVRQPNNQRQNSNIVMPSTPVALTIVPKTLAQVQAQVPNVKPGATAEVVVKVNRQFEYTGPYKVELVTTPEAKDVSAKAVTLAANETEVKLPLAVAAAAKPGARNNLIIRVTAMFNDKIPVVTDAKVNLNVVK